MTPKSELLNELYQARFDGLKELAVTYQVSKSGSVEVLRARLIQHLILEEWDLSPEGIKKLMNAELGEILGVFGIKNPVRFEHEDNVCTFTSIMTPNN